MNFSAWAIRRPLPPLMLFFILCVAGLWSFQHLSVARFPDVSLPMTTVSVSQPGAAPTQLEAEVTRKVEDAVATIPGIKRVYSSIDEGMSTTMLEFHMDTELSEALDDTRDAVSRIRMDLPQDIMEPVVSKVDIGGALQTWAVVAPQLQPDELSWFVDRDVTRAMYGIDGVAEVKRQGGIDRQVRVDLDPAALQAFGVTAGMVSQQLARFQLEQAGGKVELDGGRQVIRTIGTLATAQELAGYSIALPDGRSVRLSQLAAISDGAADAEQRALLDGQPAVAFSISRTRQASEPDVADAVEAAVGKLMADNPGIEIRLVTDMVEETRTSYSSSMMMLYEGALLAVLVVWLFLRDWRATWIAAVALPLSIVPTFAVMYFFDFSLNILTLLALAAVVGILVDDAIVEIENIVRHLRMGKTPIEAAREAADEIGMAVVATSITLAAVFLPVAFMPGIAGKFFREFGWTAATAVLFSLLVARLLTPMMAAYLLKPDDREHRQGRLMTWYLGWVGRALRHRGRTLWIAFGLFVGSMALVPLIPSTFIPYTDLGRSNLSLELAPGTSLEQTTVVAERARSLLADIPELEQVYTLVGGVLDNGDPGASPVGEVRKAMLTLDWGPAGERDRDQKALERLVREQMASLPGVRVSFISNEPGEKMQLVLAGDDPQRLGVAAEALERDLRSLQGLGSIQSSAALLRPEIQIIPDPVRAADLGVATADIAEAARIATSGDYTQRMAKLNLPERQIPIRVGLAESALANPALVGQLRVPGRNGPVPLSAVADIRIGSGPSTITHYQRQRSVTLNAELNGRPLGEVMAQVNTLPSLQQLPDGVQFITAGDAEVFVEMFTGFALAMAAGIICIYMVLLLLLNHPLLPVTILAAVPLSAGGAFGALLLTGNMLSLPSLIGLLMLIGIATKNSILLVDYAVIAENEHGLSQHDALVDACRKRAQPVIMTTLAMGAGMLPIVLGFSGDSSVRGPMAVAVIGGLITSTVLSLVVIPAAYSVIEDLGRWIGQRLGQGERPGRRGAA